MVNFIDGRTTLFFKYFCLKFNSYEDEGVETWGHMIAWTARVDGPNRCNWRHTDRRTDGRKKTLTVTTHHLTTFVGVKT